MEGRIVRELQQRVIDTRLNNWLWLYLRQNGLILSADSFGAENVRAYLSSRVTEVEVHRLIGRISQQYLLPQETFKWIMEDERQINWLDSYAFRVLKVNLYPCPPGLFGRNLIIAKIDLSDQELGVKSGTVDRMRMDWNEYLKSDTIFEWFKEGEEVLRCELAWSWLVENKGEKTYGRAPISNYTDLLMFFDWLTENVAEKNLIVSAIKKRWSQKEYRKKMVGKKQYNFVLSDQAIMKLDRLAAQHEVSRPQILEALIHFETENGSYLPGKTKKRLELS